MNRTELIVATALVLVVAFALGWFAYWLLHHFTRVTRADLEELDAMATSLHDAEEARDAAMAHLEAREDDMRHESQQHAAELSATMAALREARIEVADLREHIERAPVR